MSGWRAALVALVAGGLVLAAGYLVPRLGAEGGVDLPGFQRDASTLACAPVLSDFCEQVASRLDVTVSVWRPGAPLPDGPVLAALGDLPPGADVSDPVASSPIVIGAWRERGSVLARLCGGAIDLKCVRDTIGRRWAEIGGSETWGDVKLGLSDASLSEAGLLAWWTLTEEGVPDLLPVGLRLTSRDDDGLTADMVLFGDARADVAVTTEVAMAAQLANAPLRGGRLEIWYPSSSPWIDYVVAGDVELAGDLLDPTVQLMMAAAGLRPVVAVDARYPEGMGTPGTRVPDPDDATRATLVSTWERR